MKPQTKFDLRAFCKLYDLDLESTANTLKVPMPPHPELKNFLQAKSAYMKADFDYDKLFAAKQMVEHSALSFEQTCEFLDLQTDIRQINEGEEIYCIAWDRRSDFWKEKIKATAIFSELMDINQKSLKAGPCEDVCYLALAKCLSVAKNINDTKQTLNEISGWSSGKDKWGKLYNKALKKMAVGHGYKK